MNIGCFASAPKFHGNGPALAETLIMTRAAIDDLMTLVMTPPGSLTARVLRDHCWFDVDVAPAVLAFADDEAAARSVLGARLLELAIRNVAAWDSISELDA